MNVPGCNVSDEANAVPGTKAKTNAQLSAILLKVRIRVKTVLLADRMEQFCFVSENRSDRHYEHTRASTALFQLDTLPTDARQAAHPMSMRKTKGLVKGLHISKNFFIASSGHTILPHWALVEIAFSFM